MGFGDWGLGIGPNPQSPIPNPQSPIPIPSNLKSEGKNLIVEHNGEEKLEYRALIKLSDFKNGNKISLVIYYYSFYN